MSEVKHRPQDVERRVAAAYFQTTSAAAVGNRDAAADARATLGLRRRLGRWLEVAGLDVVDLGSGTGELCQLAVEGGAASVVGVNLCAEEIAFARTRVTAEFHQGDVVVYLEGRAPASVDRIYALNLLEHLSKEDLVRLLEAAHRCLRPGGLLVAMVPNATSPFGGMTRYWDITHQNAFTPSSVRQLARLTGFGDGAEFRECGPVPHGVVSGLRYGLWQLIRLVIRGYLMVELASAKGGIYTADMLFRLRKVVPNVERIPG